MKTIKNKKKNRKLFNIKNTEQRRKNKKTKKNIVGGTPKINFAYTYCIIDYELLKKLPLLNSYLLEKSRICDCISINKPLQECAPKSSSFSFLQNASEKCILVLKYNDLVDITNTRYELLNNPDVLNRILGHAKTIQTGTVIGVYDVCLHLTNKIGYGSVLFNIILIAINFYPDLPNNNVTLWLGIRIDNVNFSKIAYLYTMKGFCDPIVSSKDINGQKLPFEFIQLTKKLHSYVTNEDDVLINYAKTMDLYQQAIKIKKSIETKQPYVCKLKFTLDKSAILSLRLFPYIGEKGITNVLTENLQRECSGIFKIFNARLQNDQSVIYKLSLETLAENAGIKYIKGDPESVLYANGDRTFHTHPIAAYIKYQVLIGTPSGADFVSFYYRFKDYKNTQFTSVIAIEGIYIISLSESVLMNQDGSSFIFTDEYMENIKNNYEYPFSERPYNWLANGDFDETVIPRALEKYLDWFKNVNQNFNNLFELQFIPWKKLQKDTVIQVSYPKLDGHCYCEDDYYNL